MGNTQTFKTYSNWWSLVPAVGSGLINATAVAGASTNDQTPTFSGNLDASLDSGEELAVYATLNSVTSKLGVATINSGQWTYTHGSDLAVGDYVFTAVVQAAGSSNMAAGRIAKSAVLSIDTAAPTQNASVTTVTDNYSLDGGAGTVASPATLSSGQSTDDSTPTLTGSLSTALSSASQVVSIYDTYNGARTKVGQALGTGTSWSYTRTTDLGIGKHSFEAVVENKATGAQQSTAPTPFELTVNSLSTLTVSSQLGANQALTARYVLLFNNDQSGLWGVNELQVIGTNGTNIALNKTLTAGSGGFANIGNLVDGNSYTKILTGNDTRFGNWVQVDLGSAQAIQSISVINSISNMAGGDVYLLTGNTSFATVNNASTLNTTLPQATAVLNSMQAIANWSRVLPIENKITTGVTASFGFGSPMTSEPP